TYERAPTDALSVKVFGTYLKSAATARERLSVDRSDMVLLPNAKVVGYSGGTEAHLAVSADLSLTAVVDYTVEHHTLGSFDTLLLEPVFAADGSELRAAGTVIPPLNGVQR